MSGEKQSCETLLAGLGPAGLGVLTWLESIGALETILATTRDGVDHSIVVVDPRPSSDLGSGGLGYLATSNTTSSMFVRNHPASDCGPATKTVGSSLLSSSPYSSYCFFLCRWHKWS
jgi:hypothetical protein